MYRCKGTITVFLSLISMLFLSLFCTMAESARVQGARFQAAAAFDMGLFSMFGEYDKVLLEEYDLWFLDSTYGNRAFSTDAMEARLRHFISPNIHPSEGISAKGCWHLFPTELDKCSVDKYALATDDGGQVFYKQVVENEKELLAGNTISAMRKNMDEIRRQEISGEQYEREERAADENLQKEIEKQRELEAKEANQTPQSQNKQGDGNAQKDQTSDYEAGKDIQMNAENPLEKIKRLKRLGILSLVMKDSSQISDKKMSISSLPSKRVLKKGNLNVRTEAAGVSGELVFLEYLKNHFTCAVDKEKKKIKEHALTYELEYIIAGKTSDAENLKKVVNKLLLLREGANYVCICGSASMKEEALALAAAIAGAAAVPALISAFQKAIMLAWAYGESILDVRSLLAGGKIPAVKTEADWKLSLEKLGDLEDIWEGCDGEKEKGRTYQEYLTGILALEKKKTRNMRTLDLIEANRRAEAGGENFRVDALVVRLEAHAVFELAPVFLAVPAVWMNLLNQGTAYQIKGGYGYMEGGV